MLSDDDLLTIQYYVDLEIVRRLDRIIGLLGHETKELHMDLTQLQADVTSNGDAISAAATLLSTLANEIRDNLGDPAALVTLADQLEQNTAALSSAVVANTPAAPTTGDTTGNTTATSTTTGDTTGAADAGAPTT